MTVLAALQGLTEFLPISSSGHLLLPSLLLGWPDQGLLLDIAVHLGSLLAVLVFFRNDLFGMCSGLARSLRSRTWNAESALAVKLGVASLPAGFAGLLLHSAIQAHARSLAVLAGSSVLFALALWYADSRAQSRSQSAGLAALNYKGALLVGVAQTFALIPGTSRSGVTLTAARLLGLSRKASARFSFLLSIPIILASGGLLLVDVPSEQMAIDWPMLVLAAAVSAAVALAAIHFFLKWLPLVGVLPFVIYRLLFGTLLLLWLI